MGKYQFFTDEEVQGLDDQLCQMLSIARGKANMPFVITSGRRTLDQETALKGGVRDSSHILGLAVDLECNGDNPLCIMLASLFAAGFRRIGIYHDAAFNVHHIHADIGKPPTFPQDVVWLKLEQN